ncbi:MAG: TonB-dependent receptor [Pseudomonadota bacterium]
MTMHKRGRRAVSLLALIAAAPSAALAGVIEGRVSDQSQTISLEGAVVRINETGASATTDRAGRYRLNAIPAGDYTLTVSYLGAEPVTVTVSLANDDATARQDVSLGEDVNVADNILVIGQRGSLNSGLNRERAADDFRSVLSADAIGQFPDENVAEAARRAVGVNVLNDQGEGRFVSIRGLDPNLNSTTINGVRIPSPDGGDRNVPLDVIDSDLLSAIVINKSLTPDVDADSIGGNIEIETISGLDQTDALIKLKAGGQYVNLTETFGQKYAGTYANNFMDNKLGVAASVSYRQRKFGSDNVEVDDGEWSIDDGELFPGELENRDYEITRTRFSAALNLDYRATDAFEIHAHSLFSRFTDDEVRSRIETKLGDGEFDRMEGGVSFINGTPDDELEVDRDVKDREETQTIFSVVTGGEYQAGAWTVDFAGSYSYSEEEEPNRIDTAYRANFDDATFGVDVSDTLIPRLAFADAASETAYFNTDNYEFDELELLDGVTSDEEFAANFNIQRDMPVFGYPGYIKAGAKLRFREKDRNVDTNIFDGFDGDAGAFDPLTAVARSLDSYRLGNFGPAPARGPIRDFFFANRSAFERDEFGSVAGSTIEDYVANEDVYAGYVMAKADIDRLRLVGGLRVEHTEFDASGFGVIEFAQVFDGDVEDTVTAADLNVLTPGGELISSLDTDFDDGETTVEAIYRVAQEASQSYTDYLPSLNARYEFQDNVIGRLAYYKSIVRPNISAVVPAAEVAQDEEDLEASLGNPNLDRQRAHNVDASLSWYPNRDSVLMVGAFYKHIDGFIATQTFEDFTFNGLTYAEATIAVNLDDIDLIGIEANYQQQFSFLPSPFDGFIGGVNYTFVDAEATLADGRSINLPRQSRHVGNVVLGYEKGPVNLRAAATYRDEFLDEINFAGDGLDRIVDDHLQIDLSAKFAVTDQFRLYAEAKNITNEPFIARVSDGGFGRLNSQFEEYGYSLEFGVMFKY